MPKVAQEIGAVKQQLPLDKIAARLLQMTNASH
jgi:chemotaxis response regulator CheB